MQSPFKIYRPSGDLVVTHSVGSGTADNTSVKAPPDPSIIFYAPHAPVQSDLEEPRVTPHDTAPGSLQLAEAAFLKMQSQAFLLVAKPERSYAFAMEKVVESFSDRKRVPAAIGFNEYTPAAGADRPLFIIEGSSHSSLIGVLSEKLLDKLDAVKKAHFRKTHFGDFLEQAYADTPDTIILRFVPPVRSPDVLSEVGERHGLHWAHMYVRSDIIPHPQIRDAVVVAAIEATLRDPQMVRNMLRKDAEYFPPPREELAASLIPIQSEQLLQPAVV